MRRLLFLIPVALLLTACLDNAYTGNPSGKRVGVAGDSITVNTRNAVHAALEPTYLVQEDAVIGETAYQTIGDPPNVFAVNSVNVIAATHPDVAVINLGTNVTALNTPEQINAQLDVLRAKFPPPTCVLFVTLSTRGLNAFAFANSLRAAVNDHLRAAGPVADWAAMVDADPTLVSVGDGVHPSATGQVVYAQLIHDTVDNCPS